VKHLYFIRHGESYVNIEDEFASSVGAKEDKGLTDTGKQQALVAAEQAKADGFRCDLLVCSTLLRAKQTAEIMAAHIDYPLDKIRYSDLLIEIQFGELEGRPWNEYWQAGHTYADLDKVKGAESLEMLQQRAEKALEFLHNLPEDDILIASHSAFGRALKRVIAGLPYNDEFIHGDSLPFAQILQLI
jgi:uncharacterized phosphatase